MKRKNKGGFSLVEVVIALALIVTVTATGLTIALSSITTKVKAINRTHAQYFAENVLECFKAADDAEEFEALLGVIHNEGDWHTEEERDENKTYYTCVHNSANYQFIAEVSVSYVKGARPRLDVNVSGEDGTEIIEFFYVKGVTVPEGGGA